MTTNKQTALITGGTSGIGYELAKLFAKDGYNLVLVARNEVELQRVASKLRSEFQAEVETISRDLFDPENAFEVYNEIGRKTIRIDVLVNDAGQGYYGEFVNSDLDKELAMIHLNISSLVILTKKFLREMVARNSGKILNLSSIASKVPGPFQSVYHGTKAFVQSFTEAVRDEVKDKGVTVTALLPGATATDFFNKAGMEEAKIVKEGKLDDPAKVARDGYEALMKGDDMVVSGFMNKVQVAMGNILPDSVVAGQVHKQQEPASSPETPSS